ncbi:MAG TPA: nodulation protein NfeD [Solirubrobacterales bacterium]|jgi:membrane-bound serine protease (ClpP class)|nr:nodulation protein NfeD [Solirubrobacterales bacterium]
MGQRARVSVLLWVALAALLALLPVGAGAQGSGIAYSIEFDGTVDPATERWIDQALGDAEDAGAELAIIRLDTEGGLDSSMREIIKDILAAPMPVVVYVSPDGSRAASAGAFITEAGDVAAMAPQTNIGSASPVSITGEDVGDVLGRKIENDAGAYIRALAEGHGRNGDLAERLVTEAENVTASEALEEGLIDVVAGSEEELLSEIDGFEVQGPKAQTLDTAGLEIERHDMPFLLQVLQVLVNPTVAYLLLTAGLVGLAIEIFNPGLIVPGTLGVISFLLGLYGTAQLPVTAAGILLLVLGIGLIIAEAHLPTHGILGGVGVLALALSGLLLFNTDSDAYEVSVPVVILVAVMLGGFMAFAVQKVVQARRNPVVTGWEELIGSEGDVRAPIDPVGQVFVEGALWRATLADGAGDGEAVRLERGDRVKVESVDGLTLRVRPVAETSEREE